MLTIRTFVVVVLGFVLVGCGITAVPVRNYCDSEVSYDLWKQESGYRLYLKVGTVASAQACRLTPDASRAINLTQDVSSPEEADKLIDKYRQIYAEKVAAAKRAKAEELPKLPTDQVQVAATPACDQCPVEGATKSGDPTKKIR
jgi:hypothetical protein